MLSERGVALGFGLKRGGAAWKNKTGARMPVFAAAKNLKPFMTDELRLALESPCHYRPKSNPGTVAYGVKAEMLSAMLRVEKSFPWVLAAIGAGAYFFFCSHYLIPRVSKDILTVVVSIAAIAVGFLATAKSILISIDHRDIIRQLKAKKVYDRIVNYLLTATYASAFVSVISAAILLWDFGDPVATNPPTWASRVIVSVWLFAVVFAFLATMRVIHIFGKLLKAKEIHS